VFVLTFLFFFLSRVLTTASCSTTKTLQSSDTRRSRHTRSNHGPSRPHCFALISILLLLSSRALRLGQRSTNTSRHHAAAVRSLLHLGLVIPLCAYISPYPFPITGTPEVPATIQNLDQPTGTAHVYKTAFYSLRRASSSIKKGLSFSSPLLLNSVLSFVGDRREPLST
jgi:hypothetical protein